MKPEESLPEFILKEWLLFGSAVSLIGLSLYTGKLPRFSGKEFEVIFILAALFVSVKGLEKSGWIRLLSLRFEQGNFVSLKLILATFFLSMIVTNDIALIVLVPLTLSLNTDRKGILVILEALAANAGSAFTPFGNPQNLYIYWFYNLSADSFISVIAPFSLTFLVLLSLACFFIKASPVPSDAGEAEQVASVRAIVYGILLLTLILTVLHIFPVWAGGIVLVYALFFDRQSLKIDFSLLLTFVFFFGIADSLKSMIPLSLQHPGHIFLFSSLLSQLISNVPATLLIAKHTNNWPALLWGVSVGGFGSLVGSFANLIAYRLYISDESTGNRTAFTLKFLLAGYLFFFIAFGLYFFLYR